MQDAELKANVNAFLTHCLQRGFSSHTRAAYAQDLMQLHDFLVAKNIDNWRAVTRTHLYAWIQTLTVGGCQARSIRRKLAAVRSAYAFWGAQEHDYPNPMQAIQLPRQRQHLPASLDVDETLSLFEKPKDFEDSWHLQRDFVLLEVLYSTGLRVSELTHLNVTDVQSGQCHIRGKGQRDRIVPLGDYALRAIELWLPLRATVLSQKNTQQNALFIGQNGTRLTSRSVQYRLAQWAMTLGFSKHLHPHLLRHAFASHLLQNSQDLRAVQELLGHQNLATTQHYTHMNLQHIASVYDQCHPRA